jgi:DNA helicase-2/ATP-dependent DNA helicase PcrA
MNREFHAMLDHEFPRIPDFDIETVPPPKEDNSDKVKNYSYTGDYLNYQRCPRQYMIFKKYDFVPSRTSTMVFGSLVHRTLEDLHEFLKAKREAA